MTDLEKLEARIEAVNAAVAATQHAATVNRKMSHDRHVGGHFTKALTELTDMQTSLNNMKTRLVTVGR
jgi:hypothetical protein